MVRTLEENADFCQLLRTHLDQHGACARVCMCGFVCMYMYMCMCVCLSPSGAR
jgi:hypothetical protein